jgi:hypothetical protein
VHGLPRSNQTSCALINIFASQSMNGMVAKELSTVNCC